jgi:hypothetical protein
LPFYREFARGTSPAGIEDVVPWKETPTFYLKTTDQSGRPVPERLVAKIERGIAHAVPQWTAGRITAAPIQRGTEARADMTRGVVNIYIHVEDPTVGGYGNATTGGRFVTGYAHFIAAAPSAAKCKREPDPEVAWSTIVHEIGHVMGYKHTTLERAMMEGGAPLYQCDLTDITAAERFHAAIMYSRPIGNRDPDSDPDTFRAAGTGPAEVVD